MNHLVSPWIGNPCIRLHHIIMNQQAGTARLHLKFGPLSLYFSCIALVTTWEISILVIFWYPSSNISSDIPFKYQYINHAISEEKGFTWISSTNIQDLALWRDILCDNVLDTWVSLIPIEWFWVTMVEMLIIIEDYGFRKCYLVYLLSQYSGRPYCVIFSGCVVVAAVVLISFCYF